MMDALRVILVGGGYIAQAEQLPGWHHESRGRLAAVVDSNPDVAAAVGAAYRTPWFTELGQAIRAVDADAVHVCTPASTHDQLIREAFAAGLHALVEKPLTNDASSAEALCALARACNLVLMIGAPRLYDPYVEWMTAAVDRHEIGAISAITTVWRMSRAPQFRHLTTTPRHRPVTSEPGSHAWLRQRLLDESIHHLGVIARWSPDGLRPMSVALNRRAYQVVLEGGGGVIVTHSNVSPAGHGETFTVYAEAGRFEAMAWSAHFPEVGGSVTIDPTGGGNRSQPEVVRVNSYWSQIAEFVAVVLGEAVPRRSPEAAVEDLALVDAIVRVAEGPAPGTLRPRRPRASRDLRRAATL